MITETINGLTSDFYSFKGKVLGSSKYSSTHVYGGGGNQYGSYPVRSYETVHDIIFIEDAGGKEHEIHMKNWDIGVREGHELLLVWAVQKAAKQDLIFMRKISTQE
ncbi:MAG: hypothetical protein IPM96_21190 [Ignavibacteria bacterium]|nr:hypothetical protein [Ignavibacteria bacterium]